MSHQPPPPAEQLDWLQTEEDRDGILPGTIRGSDDWWSGFGAGLEVYVGEGQWRPLGDVIGDRRAGLVLHQGRLTAGLSWDLGPMAIRRRAEDGAE